MLEKKDEVLASEINLRNTDQIKNINNQLRWKFLNKSVYFNPYNSLEKIDNNFTTALTVDKVYYGNFVPEDFGIDKDYFLNNAESVFNSMIKDTKYGIDYGYFMGSEDKPVLNKNDNEYIQIMLKVPKGTPVVKVGDLEKSDYILQRESTLNYTAKNFDKNSKVITITAELVKQDELNKVTNDKQKELNTKFQTLYQVSNDFIKLMPLGLNAGLVLNASFNVVSKAFESLKDGNIYSKDFFGKEKLELSNGWYTNSNLFEQKYSSMTLEQRRAEFAKQYSPTTAGETTNQMSTMFTSVITFAHYQSKDPLPQLTIDENIAAIILHETFHYLTFASKSFVNIPLYNSRPSGFEDDVEEVKYGEDDALIKLLNDDYAGQDWQEYSSEAFMAKYHPRKEIASQFIQVVPKTNRLIDKLFDAEAPSTPKNLKSVDVEGTSVKLSFDNATDNIGVNQYNIYMNGKLLKTVEAVKDKNGLSYPNPGEHQDKIELTIDELKQITNYEFYVIALDDTKNESVKSEVLKVTTKDIEAPQLTGEFVCSALRSRIVQCFWPHPTDNHDVNEVLIYRNDGSMAKTSPIVHNNEKVFKVSGDAISYTDSTIEKGKTYTYYMVAKDAAGNVSKKSNSVTITTTDEDDKDKNKDMAKDTTATDSKLDWGDTFKDVAAASFNIFSFFFSAASWVAGAVTSVAGSLTSAAVSLTVGVANLFTVIPVDKKGNPIGKGIQISVTSVDHSSIKTKDSMLYVGQKWVRAENLVEATDENGKKVDYSDDRITPDKVVDTNKAGVYTITYTYKGLAKKISSTFKVTVKPDLSSIETQDSMLYVGQTWLRANNLVKATDEDGKNVDYSDNRITPDKIVDTNKVGVYTITYRYKGIVKTSSSTFKVTVKADKASIKTQDSIVYQGETWNPADNLVLATDEAGNKVDYNDKRITKEGTVDTSKLDIFTIKYIYTGLSQILSSTFKVTVFSFITEIVKAHSNFELIYPDEGNTYRSVYFKNNIKKAMRGLLINYRVTYKRENWVSIDDMRPVNFKSDGSIIVDWLPYAEGVRIDAKAEARIYAVLKNGEQIKVYDNKGM